MAVLVVVLLLVLFCAGLLLYHDRPPADEPVAAPPPVMRPSDRLLSELYAIRRRLDVARFRFEVRGEAAEARYRLHAELRELERRTGGGS
jgi:hypothetical protein